MKKAAIALAALSLVAFLPSCTKKKTNTISGKIEIAPLLGRLPIRQSAALYLIAHAAGDASGPPIAVKRFTPPFHFPITFTLSSQDEMIPDVPFDGPFDISVRLAQSGSATPSAKGDFEGSAEPGPVQLGSKDVEIRLARVRQ